MAKVTRVKLPTKGDLAAESPLYGDELGWVTLLLQEQLDAIRRHLLDDQYKSWPQPLPGGRIDAALRAAIDYLNRGLES